MEESLFKQYLSRKYIQSTGVILLGFISLWTKYLDSTALVTLVGLSLGVYAAANVAEKKLEKDSK